MNNRSPDQPFFDDEGEEREKLIFIPVDETSLERPQRAPQPKARPKPQAIRAKTTTGWIPGEVKGEKTPKKKSSVLSSFVSLCIYSLLLVGALGGLAWIVMQVGILYVAG